MTLRHRTKERGQILLIVTAFFCGAIMLLVLGVVAPLVRQQQIGRDFVTSRISYYAAEAGSEDAFYRVRQNIAISFPYTFTINGAAVTAALYQTGAAEEQIVGQGVTNSIYRSVVKTIVVSNAVNFPFAMQSGNGGINLNNNATIYGNVFANSSITGSSNVINGNVISAGSSGLLNSIHATGTVYAHTITNAQIDKDAYYQTFAGATSTVTVSGTKHPNSADQATTSLPIADSLIATWESDAAAGGTATCSAGSYTISSNVTLGPTKIPCNLSISGNGTIVTLTGTLWVAGTISISGNGGSGVQIKVADSVGNKNVPIIADDPSNLTTGSTVTINGNSNFYGSTGNPYSYVMIISMNKSAESGGGTTAINVVNGAAGNVLTYAPHGEIKLSNNVTLYEVTAYKISLFNNSVVYYTIGLLQSLLTTGNGGTWQIKQWKESSKSI